MLPSEYQPLVLTPRQQQNHDLITSCGFRISPRPFAGKGEVLYFFAMRGDVEYTVDMYFGSVYQTGTENLWKPSELQAAFGSDQTATTVKENAHPVVEEAVVPPPAKAETAKPQAAAPAVPVSRERPAAIAESGKAIAVASPVKPAKKKQTALF